MAGRDLTMVDWATATSQRASMALCTASSGRVIHMNAWGAKQSGGHCNHHTEAWLERLACHHAAWCGQAQLGKAGP